MFFCTLRILIVVLLAVSISTVSAATRIDLRIDELDRNRTVAWPITTGIPFPQGSLTEAKQCRLVDDRGEEQPLQTKTAATWDSKRSSIRWLTIDFIARAGRKYALEFGSDVVRGSFPAAFNFADADDLVIGTGPLEAEFSRRGPAALGSVHIDLNGDGKLDAAELVARGPKEGDHLFVGQRDAVSTGARDDDDREIVIESRGPIRTCIRVDGWYTGPQGERVVRYRTRYHLFAGLSLIKMVDEFRIVGSTRDVQFSDIALPLQLYLGDSRAQATAQLDTNPSGAATLDFNADNDAVFLRQETFRHYGNQVCRAVLEQTATTTTGSRAGSWIQVANDRAAVTGSLRWFWQQFPKEWEARSDRLTLHLWSPRVAPLDFGERGLREFFGPAGEKNLLSWKSGAGSTPITDFFYHAGRHALERDGADGQGINKHHEVWYHFGGASEAAEGQEYGRLADQQPLCLASGAWNVGTQVFGPLAARPNDSPYEAIVDRIFELERYAQDTFGDYGWWLFGAGPHYSYQWDAEAKRHVADPRRFEYHTYQRETQLWWNYFRSGERKFYDWAIPSENHWVDVAVAHVPTKYSTQWRGGTRQEATLHYVAGDWSIDSPLHYVRHHDTGEAWLRSAPQLWASYHRTLETTTLAYYLTGDERYQDIIVFWRDYWGNLAGVRNDTKNVAAWYREQLWWRPQSDGEPLKTWAEMIRDYAPFQSGSRHQMTLLFNLSTLYEHTWDPEIGQSVREFADAYLAPENPNGVWQCQDHRLPANADSPMLAHYWSPALWKYTRATQDPRMPEILKKYFTACLEADPYGEDVGIYSNVQIAWAWHFLKDPHHLIAAKHELESLLPNALPLEKPEDLGRRIYNPYAPIKSLAAVPRLIGILEEARRSGIAVPARPPLTPQRTWIAIERAAGLPLEGVLWGWDEKPALLDKQGRSLEARYQTATHRSHRQPFDRATPGYQVFRNEFQLAAPPESSWCFLRPHLETGILQLSHDAAVWCWAGDPIAIEPRETWFWRRTDAAETLTLESTQATSFTVRHGERALPSQDTKGRAVFSLADVPSNAVLSISFSGERGVWFRIAEPATAAAAWVSPVDPSSRITPPATPKITSPDNFLDLTKTFVPGRFGEGLLVVPGRELRIPDKITGTNGEQRRLSDPKQGTIEFWIRRLWDDRVTTVSQQPILTAGAIYAPLPANLPYGDWAHVAVVWHPIPKDETNRSLVHVYVDGVDFGNYRSIYWQGYAQPPTFSPDKEQKDFFSVRSPPGASFIIDDIRISSEPRYLDLTLDFGRSQTFNPHSFARPTLAAPVDAITKLLLPLDGHLRAMVADQVHIEATLIDKSP